LSETPGVSVVTSACQTTDLRPPGKPAGRGSVAPARKTFPENPDSGTVVFQVFVTGSNVVEAVVASGENVTVAALRLREFFGRD